MSKQLDEDLLNKITRFHRYLREQDAKAMLEFGYPIFKPLADKLDELFHVKYREQHKKRALLGRGAEGYAWKLGVAIQNYGESLLYELQNNKFRFCNADYLDWQGIVEIGEILQVGWNVKYFNRDC